MKHLIRLVVGTLSLAAVVIFLALMVKHFAIVFVAAWVAGVGYLVGLLIENLRAELKWKRTL